MDGYITIKKVPFLGVLELLQCQYSKPSLLALNQCKKVSYHILFSCVNILTILRHPLNK